MLSIPFVSCLERQRLESNRYATLFKCEQDHLIAKYKKKFEFAGRTQEFLDRIGDDCMAEELFLLSVARITDYSFEELKQDWLIEDVYRLGSLLEVANLLKFEAK